MHVETAAPRWDLGAYFSGLDSVEFSAARRRVEADLAEVESVFDDVGVGKSHVGPCRELDFDRVTRAYNAVADCLRLIVTYVSCFVDTNSRDELAQAIASELDPLRVRLNKLRMRWIRWVGEMDEAKLLEVTEEGAPHRFAISKARVLASHQMTADEEDLAADLQLNGSTAWEKLYGNLTSQIEAPVALPEGTLDLPMSRIRNLAYDSSPVVREAAYRAELEAWRAWETPISAALNGIKGEFLELNARRKWADPLDSAMFTSNIDAETLEAMMSAARERFPAFRRYLKAKAKRLGFIGAMPWHGLFAPISTSESSSWPYKKACSFIESSFASYSDELAEFARQSFDRRWVDAEPRAGKADGGYCTWTRDGESRIFMNYKPSFGSVSTLAHELGHAYHNWMLRDRTALQRQTPMTLAETASIFCETIIRRAGLEQGSEEDRLAILEASLMGSCQIVIDISSRFLFERSVFQRRAERELSASELCEFMLQAQRETYGDGLDSAVLHPYMWAAKPHYYSGGYSYYNYPYMFGLLFGLGLYAIYEREPDGFLRRYNELLSSTGLAEVATCAGWFGINVREVGFWRASLDMIERDIDHFVQISD